MTHLSWHEYAARAHEFVPRGADYRRAMLTDEIVRKARQMAAQGTRYQDIADYFGVSKRTLEKAIRYETWRHVE